MVRDVDNANRRDEIFRDRNWQKSFNTPKITFLETNSNKLK